MKILLLLVVGSVQALLCWRTGLHIQEWQYHSQGLFCGLDQVPLVFLGSISAMANVTKKRQSQGQPPPKFSSEMRRSPRNGRCWIENRPDASVSLELGFGSEISLPPEVCSGNNGQQASGFFDGIGGEGQGGSKKEGPNWTCAIFVDGCSWITYFSQLF